LHCRLEFGQRAQELRTLEARLRRQDLAPSAREALQARVDRMRREMQALADATAARVRRQVDPKGVRGIQVVAQADGTLRVVIPPGPFGRIPLGRELAPIDLTTGQVPRPSDGKLPVPSQPAPSDSDVPRVIVLNVADAETAALLPDAAGPDGLTASSPQGAIEFLKTADPAPAPRAAPPVRRPVPDPAPRAPPFPA
jgi:hypothetical protein